MELFKWANGKTLVLTEIEAIDLKQRLARMLDTGLYHDDTPEKLEIKIERQPTISLTALTGCERLRNKSKGG